MNTIMITSTGRQARHSLQPAYAKLGLLLLLALLLPATTAQADAPATLGYQAYLTDATGAPVDGELDLTFALYTQASGGGFHWLEEQTVTVSHGLFSVELGHPDNPLPMSLFNVPQWLGVKVGNNAEMTPRRPLTSVAFVRKSADTDLLQGISDWALDQSAHVTDFDNPHAVTAAQAGAVATGAFVSHGGDPSAHHWKTSVFAHLSDQAANAQIPAGIARDTELTWNSMAGTIPQDFADGEDNIGFGDISGVLTTAGLAGGGTSGDVTVELDVPLALPGDLLLGNGNLGIGLNNPNRRLYVLNNTEGMNYALKLDNPHPGINTTGVGMLFSTEGNAGVFAPARGKGALAYTSTNTWNRGAFHFLQDTGTDTAIPDMDDAVMTIANNGRVGIGTRLPGEKLDVRGPCLTLACDPSPAYVSVDGGFTGLSGYWFNEAGAPRWRLFFRQWQSDNLVVHNDGVGDVMTFESGTGRVGIGTGTPQARLDVAGDVKFRNNLDLSGGVVTTSHSLIPASAFVREHNDEPLSIRTNEIHSTSYSDVGTACAPVYLPHGATIVRLTSRWYSTHSSWHGDIEFRRGRLNDPGYSDRMSEMFTSWDTEPHRRAIIDNTVEFPVIDNFRYRYYLKVAIPPNQEGPGPSGEVSFYDLKIEYTRPVS